MDFLIQGNSSLFIGGFVIYIIAMILLAYFTTRGKTDGEDYLMGGRNLGLILLISTLVATAIGTGSSIGGTSKGFTGGLAGSVFGFANAIGFVVLGWFFCKVRKYNLRTICEEVQFYYGGNLLMRKVMGIMLYIIEMIWVANHINGGSKYLSYVTGMDELGSKLITVLAFAIYVFIGGYMAVVWTDAVQAVILFAGFIIITFMAIPTAGGIEAIKEAYINAGNPGALTMYGIGSTGLWAFFSLTVAAFMGNIIVPSLRMRIYTAKDASTARKGMFTTAVIVFFFSFIPSIIGMAGFAIATHNGASEVFANPDFTFHYMATTVLGPLMGLFFLIAGLSATMSSADSEIIAGVTVFLTDIYSVFTKKKIDESKIPKYSRYVLVVTLIIAFGITLYAKDVIGFINTVIGAVAPCIGITILMGRFYKKTSWQGGMGSLVGGFIFGMIYLLVPALHTYINSSFGGPAIPVSIVAIILNIVISLFTYKVDTRTDNEIMKVVMKERYEN